MLRRDDIIVAWIVGALAAVLLAWGVTILSRALNGDRFTRRGRAAGRWLNPVSRRLFASGLLCLLLGSGCYFFVVHVLVFAHSFLWHAALTLLMTGSLALLAWCWAGRRSAGRPRCPKCLYDVSTISGRLCPECGFEPHDGELWHKPARRNRGVAGSLLLLLLALFSLFASASIDSGWRRTIPTSVLVGQAGWLPKWILGPGDPWQAESVAGSLHDRLAQSRVSRAQRLQLSKMVEQKLAATRSPDSLVYWVGIASGLHDPIAPKFDLNAASDFITRALLPERGPHGPETIDSMFGPDWSGLAVLPPAEAGPLVDQLRDAAASSSDERLNALRFLVMFTLEPTSPEAADAYAAMLLDASSSQRQFYYSPFDTLTQELCARSGSVLVPRLWQVLLTSDSIDDRDWAFGILARAQPQSTALFPVWNDPNAAPAPGGLDPESRQQLCAGLSEAIATWRGGRDIGLPSAFLGTRAASTNDSRAILAAMTTRSEAALLLPYLGSDAETSAHRLHFRLLTRDRNDLFTTGDLLSKAHHADSEVRVAIAWALTDRLNRNLPEVRAYDEQILELASEEDYELVVQLLRRLQAQEAKQTQPGD